MDRSVCHDVVSVVAQFARSVEALRALSHAHRQWMAGVEACGDARTRLETQEMFARPNFILRPGSRYAFWPSFLRSCWLRGRERWAIDEAPLGLVADPAVRERLRLPSPTGPRRTIVWWLNGFSVADGIADGSFLLPLFDEAPAGSIAPFLDLTITLPSTLPAPDFSTWNASVALQVTRIALSLQAGQAPCLASLCAFPNLADINVHFADHGGSVDVEVVQQWAVALRQLKTVVLQANRFCLDALACLSEIPSLRTIDVKDCWFEGEGWRSTASSRIETLSLRASRLTNESHSFIFHVQWLKRLTLWLPSDVTGANFDWSGLPLLEDVGLSGSAICDEALHGLGECTMLRTMCIMSCGALRGAFFRRWTRLTNLEALVLSHAGRMRADQLCDDDEFPLPPFGVKVWRLLLVQCAATERESAACVAALLHCFPNVRSLETDADVKEIEALTLVDALRFVGRPSLCAWQQLKSLRNLCFNYPLSDDQVATLGRLPALEMLSFSPSTPDGPARWAPASMLALQQVHLSGRGVSSEALSALAAAAPNLRSLQCDGGNAADPSLNVWEKLRNLERVDAFMGLSDASLCELVGLPNLKHVHLVSRVAMPNSLPRVAWVSRLLTEIHLHLPGFTDAFLSSLAPLALLRTLVCWETTPGACTATGSAFSTWRPTMARLRSVQLTDFPCLIDSGVAQLGNVPSLCTVELCRCGSLSGACCAEWSTRLPDLVSVALYDSCNFGDEGLAALGGLRSLKLLDISGTCCTGRGFDSWTGVGAMQRLTVPVGKDYDAAFFAALVSRSPRGDAVTVITPSDDDEQ